MPWIPKKDEKKPIIVLPEKVNEWSQKTGKGLRSVSNSTGTALNDFWKIVLDKNASVQEKPVASKKNPDSESFQKPVSSPVIFPIHSKPKQPIKPAEKEKTIVPSKPVSKPIEKEKSKEPVFSKPIEQHSKDSDSKEHSNKPNSFFGFFSNYSSKDSSKPIEKDSSASFSDSIEDHKFGDLVYWGIVAASLIGIVVILGFIALQQSNPDNSQAFTAIFFDDYNKSIDSGFASFSVTIENHEGKEMQYNVDINVDSQNVRSLSFSLPKDQNHSESIRIPVNLSQTKPHKISVSLRDRKESLHFWTEVKKEYPAIFGENNLAFISYKIEPEFPKIGEDFNITYTWKCLNPTDLNYRIFVHFVDATVTIIFQNDHSPQKLDANKTQINYPTASCQPDVTFSETFQRVAPTHGDYSINVGFYQDSVGRMPVDTGNPERFFKIGVLRVQ